MMSDLSLVVHWVVMMAELMEILMAAMKVPRSAALMADPKEEVWVA